MNNFPAMTEEQRQELIGRLRIYMRTVETGIKAGLATKEDVFNLTVWKIALAALNATPAPVLRVPDGWALVPVDPTEDMLAAAKEWFGLTTTAEGVYEKMLAAAPTFPGETSKPYGWIAEYPTVPPCIGGITYSFHDNRDDAREEADAYNGHVVEVIRR